MTDFSFSYSSGPAARKPDNGPLWSFNSAEIMPGPSNTAMLHAQRTGAGMLVQPDVARALELCAPFRTLEAHTQRVTELLPALKDHADHTRQTLANIAQQGFMESSIDAWQRLTANAASQREDLRCRLFILTCDRPEALKRLLRPLVSQLSPEIIEGLWIIDDSRALERAAQNEAIVQETGADSRVPLHYFGEDARAALTEHLVQSAPAHSESVHWLLDRTLWPGVATYGQARNVALLLSVGKRALMMDDDTLPEAVSPPRTAGEFKFAKMSHREAAFFASAEELERHALVLTESPVSLMLKTLGAPLGSVISQHLGGHRALQGMSGRHIARYGHQTAVLLAQCGSWGDSGSEGPRWLLTLPDPSIKRLLETGPNIEDSLFHQHCWAGYPGPTISSFGALSQWTGLDHTALLPPYLPAGRNEDLLFGIMLQRLHPEAAVFNTEWAIRHAPINARAKMDLGAIQVQPGIGVLADWLGREPMDQHGLPPERRLAGLSEELMRLVDMDQSAKAQLLGQQLNGRRLSILNQCMRNIDALKQFEQLPGKPSWERFLTASRDQLVKDIQSPTLSNELGTNGDSGPLDFHALEQHGHRFATALLAWPELCAAARELHT